MPPADAAPSAFADAIVALIAPEGGWPVFARFPDSVLTGTVVEGAAVTPRLDPDWLEVVAAVRPALARFEAAQLGAGSGRLAVWSNRPGDPWQNSPGPGLLAVFGPPGTVPTQPSGQATVALAVIDRFAETIPASEHIAAVAFPHDLPPGRAPQAVLLAVPPVVDEELTTDALIDVIEEVRALARARMAAPDTLGAAVGPVAGEGDEARRMFTRLAEVRVDVASRHGREQRRHDAEPDGAEGEVVDVGVFRSARVRLEPTEFPEAG